MENYNNTKYERSLIKQHSNYYTWYYLIYEATKDKVLFPEYNKEYEENFAYEIENAGITIDTIKKNAQEFKREHTFI